MMWICAIVVPALLAGCAANVSTVQPSSTSSPTLAGCPKPLTTTKPGEQQKITTRGSGVRTYNVWLPRGYTGKKAVPVLVDLHGASGEAVEYVTKFSGMAQRAPSRGYLLVAPQARKNSTWSIPGYDKGTQDPQFIEQMLVTLATKYCTDSKRQYVSGFSLGGGFATYLACQLNGIAAAAPLSGVTLVRPCVGKPAVPLAIFHGTGDISVRYTGDTDVGPRPDGEIYLGDVVAVTDALAKNHGCATTHLDEQVSPDTVKRTFVNCPAGSEVKLFSSQGTGHTYPGGPELSPVLQRALGKQSSSFDAAKEILDFFDSHTAS